MVISHKLVSQADPKMALNDPHFLVFTPLYNLFPWSVGWPSDFFFFFLIKFDLFCLFLVALGLYCCVGYSLVAVNRGYSLLWWVSSLWWLLLLWNTGSRVHGLQELQLLDFRAQAQLLWPTGLVACGVWDLPKSGTEPMSHALKVDSLPLSHQGTPCCCCCC